MLMMVVTATRLEEVPPGEQTDAQPEDDRGAEDTGRADDDHVEDAPL